MNKRIALSIFAASAIISCTSVEEDGVPCDCSHSVEIKNEIVLKQDNLPDDLTCVLTDTGINRLIINEIVSLYKALFQSQLTIKEDDERVKTLKAELVDWLGGAHIGDCGNLARGLKINGFDDLGESIDIEINTKTVELTRKNGKQEKAPFWYQGDVTFSISISGGSERTSESNAAKAYLVFATCNQYSAIQ